MANWLIREKMKRHTNETITITNELKSGMAKVEQFNKNMAYVGVASPSINGVLVII